MTGACGFIGSHISEALVEAGHTVFAIDNLSTGNIDNIRHINNNKFFLVKSDIRDHQKIVPDIDWFFHLAAKADVVPSIEDPLHYHDVNVTGTVRMLEYARQLKVKKFVYAASSSCYGDDPITPTQENYQMAPQYPYALTKLMGERYVRHWRKVYSLPATVLRLFNVYGPRSRTTGAYGAVMGVFLSQIANGKPLTIVGDGTQRRDFTFVKDVAQAFIKAAEYEGNGIFNVGTGRSQSIKHLACLFGQGPGDLEYIPDRPGEPPVTLADTRLIRRKLRWESKTTFEDGCAIMLKEVDKYKDAPLWDKESIAKATKSWFEYLS